MTQRTTAARKQAFFMIGNKGGIGKTMSAQQLADDLRNVKRKPTLLLDLDSDNRTLSKMYCVRDSAGNYDHAANQEAALANPPSGALSLNVADEADITELGEYLFDPDMPWEFAVVDYKAGNQNELSNMFGTLSALAGDLINAGIDVTLCLVVNHDQDAAEGIPATVCAWGAGPRLIVIKNPKEQKLIDKAFDWYDGELSTGSSISPADAVQIAGGVEMTMPVLLGAEEIKKVTNQLHVPLSQAPLQIVNKRRAAQFRDGFRDEFWRAFDEVMTRPGSTQAAIDQIEAALKGDGQ